MKKIISLIIVLTVICSFATLALSAAEISGYTASELYKASKYYANLSAVTLTGDGRADALNIAVSQLGYHEGNSDDDLDGMNPMGNKNFVEYNVLYGKVDNDEGNGKSYGYAWCASFVSWCMRQAKVSTDVVCKEISCPRMITFFSGKGVYKTVASGYKPIAGDIIFFKSSSSTATSSHVGLVRGIKDGKVYTIEGNSGGIVGYHAYELTDTYIVGYASPKYNSVAGTDYSVFDLTDDGAMKPGVYYTTADSLNFREGIGTSYSIITALDYMTKVNITEIKDGWGKTTINSKTGWLSMSYAMSENDLVYTLKFDANYGKNAPLRQKVEHDGSVIITADKPTRTGYDFYGWADSAMSTVPDYMPGDTYKENKDLTLYAIWLPSAEDGTTAVAVPAGADPTETTAAVTPSNEGCTSGGTVLPIILTFALTGIGFGVVLFVKKH